MNANTRLNASSNSPILHRHATVRPWSRRQFLQTAAVTGLASPFFISQAAQEGSANGKLHHACIGVGGMGWGDLNNFLQHKRTQVVALCDVDANHLAKAAAAAPGARCYSDWRELLEKEGDRIDSVNVTVPDHMHFPIAFSAIQKGKHVYCQKPLCHDVGEVRALTEAAVKRGVVTQLGTQIAATPHDRTGVNWLKAGHIGKVRHAYLCSNRPGAVEAYRLKGPRPAAGAEAPKELNWDLWLGTAPRRPFAPDIYHPVKWRAWLDFGTGWSGDIGCHVFDPVWKGLGLKPALSVIAEVQESWKNSPERRADTWPQGNHITWTFPGNSLIEGDELVLEWFDGEFYPPEPIRKLYTADLKEYPAESAMLGGHRRRPAHSAGLSASTLARGQIQGRETAGLAPTQSLSPFCRRLPGRRKDRVSFCPIGSDGRGDSPGHGRRAVARAETGMGPCRPEG